MRFLTRTHCDDNALPNAGTVLGDAAPNADALPPQCGLECARVLLRRAKPAAVTIRYVKVAPRAPNWLGGCRGGCGRVPRQADLALRSATFVADYEMGSWVGGVTPLALCLARAQLLHAALPKALSPIGH